MYTKDLEQLDELVEKLKTRGITKANRSALIRVALEQLDLDKVPRGHVTAWHGGERRRGEGGKGTARSRRPPLIPPSPVRLFGRFVTIL